MLNYRMGRPDLWLTLGSGRYGLGAPCDAAPPPDGAGPRSSDGFDAGAGLGPLRMRSGIGIPPVPPGTSWRTADAVRLWFAVHNAMGALTDPLTPKARERVEEALAIEDGRVLWERVFGPPTGACACTRTSGAEISTSSPPTGARPTRAALHAWPALWARCGRRRMLARSLGRPPLAHRQAHWRRL